MAKSFPCPYCKGRGGERDVVLDYGQGPWYDCGVCKGEGMIEINGPIHQQMRDYKECEKAGCIYPDCQITGEWSGTACEHSCSAEAAAKRLYKREIH